MSDSNAVKIDIGLGGMFDFCLPNNDRGDSLSGNEVHTHRNDDDGAAEIPDPVENFCKAVRANRFNEAKPIPGRLLEKRAGSVAHRVEQLGNWRLEYDASNRLIRAREVDEGEKLK
jgi:YD repeat-containing protein